MWFNRLIIMKFILINLVHASEFPTVCIVLVICGFLIRLSGVIEHSEHFIGFSPVCVVITNEIDVFSSYTEYI